jgi:hypothetical protein
MRKCFVISPIGQEGSEIRKHADDVFDYLIKPAMEKCHITAFRSDHLDKPGRISEQMFQSIYQADLCIAVLTNYNPNVFYELAVAQSAQRPVIILIEKGQQLPFDISDLRCVYYDLEIRSYNEQTHIKRIINYVNEFEAADWRATDFFSAFRPPPAPGVKDLEFFETSGEYGTERAWLELLQETKNVFDIMGVSLSSWRKTKDFGKIVLQKAEEGCKVRILLMQPDNPILNQLIYLYGMTYENVRNEVDQNFSFYEYVSRGNENIEVRQIHRGIPHFFLTRNDRYAVLIQYLSAQTWGAGPLWRCTKDLKLYGVVKDEFETLWDLNKQAPGSET